MSKLFRFEEGDWHPIRQTYSGPQWAYEIAKEVEKYPHLVESRLYAQAQSYAKLGRSFEVALGKRPSEAAELLAKNYRFSGWSKEVIFRTLFQQEPTAPEMLSARYLPNVYDVQAGKYTEHHFGGEDFVKRWNREAQLNKYTKAIGYSQRVDELMTQAERGGVGPEFRERLAAKSKAIRFGIDKGVATGREKSILQEIEAAIAKSGGEHFPARPPAVSKIAPWSEKALSTLKAHPVLATAAAATALWALQPGSWFSKKEDYNTIEGLPHGGEAERMRKILTDFGSGWQGLFSKIIKPFTFAGRAERAYKGLIKGALKAKGVPLKNVVWDVMSEASEEGLALHVLAKQKQGGLLAGMSRLLGKGEVDLTQIEAAEKLGIGKLLYAGEAKTLRRLGYKAGTRITSPISNPITARWQALLYGSVPDKSYGPDFLARLVNKQITKDEFQSLYAGSFSGKLGGPGFDGFQEQGFASFLRKNNSDFGSKWKGLFRLFRGTGEHVAEHSAVFGKAKFSPVQELAEKVLERVRVAEFSSRPSRAASTFWTPSVKEAVNYAERGAFGGTSKGVVSRTTVSAGEAFFTRQSYYTNLVKSIGSGQKNKEEWLDLARSYWQGVDPSTLSPSHYKDVEALVTQAIKPEKAWEIERVLKRGATIDKPAYKFTQVPSAIDKSAWHSKHLESMVRAGTNASKAGRRHVHQTGKIVV